MTFNDSHLSTCCFLICCGSLLTVANAAELEERFPTPNPPFYKVEDTKSQSIPREEIPAIAATTEWTFHKTVDGSHPNGQEQQIVWLMNRARANPTQEGQWLATSTDPDVAGGRDYFQVDTTLLQNEFAAYDIKPPAAFDNRLYAAAHAHSLDLIARDAQDHDQQFDRVQASGFHYSSARGSVFSYADSGLNTHAAWNIDWGPDNPDDGDGVQAGRGHRMAVMAADGDYSNIGVAAIQETDQNTNVGEYVTTGNYCSASTSYADHFNIFIVGTVWEDANDNDQYDPGEGKSNVNVTPDQGTYYAVTGDSGGYAIPVSSGTYNVTFSGVNLPNNYVKIVTINGVSALLDLEAEPGIEPPIVPGPHTTPTPAIWILLR